MQQSDIDLARLKAATDQIDAVFRSRPSGNGGTVCLTGNLRDSMYDYQGNGRFKWLKQFIHTLRYGCD